MTPPRYVLTLYVLGDTPVSRRAIANLEAICAGADVDASYDIEVINLEQRPELADDASIVATPLLVKRLPPPMRRIIGDLSDRDKVLYGLDLRSGEQGT